MVDLCRFLRRRFPRACLAVAFGLAPVPQCGHESLREPWLATLLFVAILCWLVPAVFVTSAPDGGDVIPVWSVQFAISTFAVSLPAANVLL